MNLGSVINFSDSMIFAMSIPNIIGLYFLSSGLKKDLREFLSFCKNLKLNIVGLMCIPPISSNSDNYFNEMKILNKELNLQELSMGMSSDYLNATRNSSTYLRIGSKIFGNRV